MDEGEIGWDQVMKRWKARGPANKEFVEKIQHGYKELQQMLEVA
jgi:ring-1,2-phenylacetyl-CoA epoxidase subunit PaaA